MSAVFKLDFRRTSDSDVKEDSSFCQILVICCINQGTVHMCTIAYTLYCIAVTDITTEPLRIYQCVDGCGLMCALCVGSG